jgi:hypothetical protein
VYCIGVAQPWQGSPGICYGFALASERRRVDVRRSLKDSVCPPSGPLPLTVARKALLAQGSSLRMTYRHAVLSAAVITPSAQAGLLALLPVFWFALKVRRAQE